MLGRGHQAHRMESLMFLTVRREILTNENFARTSGVLIHVVHRTAKCLIVG